MKQTSPFFIIVFYLFSGQILAQAPDTIMNPPPILVTPNSDGYNDFLIIEEASSGENELIIFNRWGSQVYYSRPYRNSWDGKSNTDQPLLEGTYFYVFRQFQGERISKEIRSTITLIR